MHQLWPGLTRVKTHSSFWKVTIKSYMFLFGSNDAYTYHVIVAEFALLCSVQFRWRLVQAARQIVRAFLGCRNAKSPLFMWSWSLWEALKVTVSEVGSCDADWLFSVQMCFGTSVVLLQLQCR